MAKPPKSSEVLMYGEKVQPSQRAEIISFDKDGKTNVSNGGVMRVPRDEKKKPPQSPPAAAAPPPARKEPPQAQPAPQPQHQPKPQPQPARPPVATVASAKEQSRAIAAGAVGSVVDKLKQTAAAKGGMLSIQDIDAMQAEFAEKTREMEAQLEVAFETFGEARERQNWAQKRGDPFFRLMVKQFSHLFKEKPGSKAVCRRMLPGLSMAIGMLLGPDLVETYQDRCRGIVARIKSEVGEDAFDWEMFYAERDALTVSLDAQVIIAQHFADYDKRMNWFITLVNSHLAPADDQMREAEQRWELQEAGFRRLLDALTGNLRKVLSSDKGRERLIKRHGADTVQNALTALKRLVTG